MCSKTELQVQARWDAGDTGCARLIVGLHSAMAGLNAGSHLEVLARDAGAMIDIPAWCRITGHDLVFEDHPAYIIRKYGD